MVTFREFRERPSSAVDVFHQEAILPSSSRRFQGERAGFVSRAIAAGIDVTLIFVVVLLTAAGLWMLSFILDPTAPGVDLQGRIPEIAVLVLYGYFLNWLYWTICWGASGRTIGNLVMGLRVVNHHGDRMRWGGAALRALFCTTVPIGLLWVLVSGANRSVQDVVMRTSVIYDWVISIPGFRKAPRVVPVPVDEA